MELTEFLDRHNACKEGRKRAAAFSSLEDAWQNCTPSDLIWVATRPGVLTDRELRRFSVFCARGVQHLMEDQRSIAAIDVADRHANGEATDDELRASSADAAAAHAASARADAAYVAAVAASAHAADAYASADAAADAAAVAASARADAAYAAYAAAAAHAAYAYAYASADADAYADAREQQAAWIRQNTKPNFS